MVAADDRDVSKSVSVFGQGVCPTVQVLALEQQSSVFFVAELTDQRPLLHTALITGYYSSHAHDT